MTVNTLEQCEDIGGRWNADGVPRRVETAPGEDAEITGFCDRDFTCREELEDARKSHSWVVFVISMIVAILAFVLGYSLLKTEPVGSALIGGGIWAIFFGSVVNWRNFGNIWRFLLLLVALVILIWFALRLNRVVGKKGKK